jgi:hypothetical protein
MNCPRLLQTTVITWLSAGNANDMGYSHPALESGATLVLTTPLPSARCTGALSGVVAMNRATPQLWNATLCAGVAVGDLVVDTTTAARFHVFRNVSGNTWALDAPLAPMTVPLVSFPSFTAPTIANGDVYADYPQPASAYFADLRSVQAKTSSAFTGSVTVYQLGLASSSRLDEVLVDDQFAMIEAYAAPLLRFQSMGGLTRAYLINDYIASGLIGGPPTNSNFAGLFAIVGGQIGVTSGNSQNLTFLNSANIDYDTIITGGGDASGTACTSEGEPWINNLQFGGVYLDTTTILQGNGAWNSWHSILSQIHSLWGPGSFDMWGNGHLGYQNPATIAATFALTGPIYLNCGTTACNGGASDVGATSLPTACGITINATNLAAAQSGSGFGHTAWIPGGASIAPIP